MASNSPDPSAQAATADQTRVLPRLLEPINRLLDPAIRRGIGSPLPLTGGLVVLEVTGRRSGITRSTPLLCMDYGFALIVSTVRDHSQWVKNLAACPQAFVWLRGQRRAVVARVFHRGELISPDTLPITVLSAAARSFSLATGSSVAVLTLA
ncbi:MAG: nitroreductase/quinone reductase family protein [Pseudomonadales bacterium]